MSRQSVRNVSGSGGLSRSTLPGLLAQWARVVDHIARHAVNDQDYAADLDVRHEISVRLRARPTSAETREMLAELDAHFVAATEERATCVHGDARAAAEGWTSAREWYYWRAAAAGGGA